MLQVCTEWRVASIGESSQVRNCNRPQYAHVNRCAYCVGLLHYNMLPVGQHGLA